MLGAMLFDGTTQERCWAYNRPHHSLHVTRVMHNSHVVCWKFGSDGLNLQVCQSRRGQHPGAECSPYRWRWVVRPQETPQFGYGLWGQRSLAGPLPSLWRAAAGWGQMLRDLLEGLMRMNCSFYVGVPYPRGCQLGICKILPRV